ncbi:hypothetical protein PV08_06676 [Exophiala spinifera]|uniref:Major facilitator superfamily (MFS) profile domain-containing protein n=1 Tax=Exophiala spinifera TaxID=91928 RepID=A0A0D2B5B9_9EURO|nr:uncharacterized protein PV08_06676 [Exophiala spinifera]KIW13895.1 hypothetical protein PV08_06676 [Exophiala spinifera]
MASGVEEPERPPRVAGHEVEEKPCTSEQQIEILHSSQKNLNYDEADQEPVLHARTWIALGAMVMLNMVQLIALNGPPVFLGTIAAEFGQQDLQSWVPNSLSLVQAVLGPVISSGSDMFQARKTLLVGSCLIAVVGAAIVPRSQSLYQVIAGQSLIGVGFASVPLAYCVPSEIVPRKWRPMVQASMQIGGFAGAMIAPVILGEFLQADSVGGWRNFYWVQMSLWALTTIGIFAGYRPPKRHTRLDHLSAWQKLGMMDWIGSFLVTAGLTLFLTGLSLGGGLYAWTNARVLSTLIIGGALLVAFGLFEWLGTKTGIFTHELFTGPNGAGRTAWISVLLIFIEGFVAASFVIFYPVMTELLFTTEPMKVVARQEGFYVGCFIGSAVFGYLSSKLRSVREGTAVGYLLLTGGLVGFATIQPGDSVNAIAFAVLSGLGLGVILALVISAIQLCTPHHLIATSTAVLTTTRALALTVGVSVYSAVFTDAIDKKTPAMIASAAAKNGVPVTSIPEFVEAFLGKDSNALGKISGVTPSVLAACAVAVKHASADSLRLVFIIAAPVSALAVLLCYFMADLRTLMDYRVDAPLEELHAKQHDGEDDGHKAV